MRDVGAWCSQAVCAAPLMYVHRLYPLGPQQSAISPTNADRNGEVTTTHARAQHQTRTNANNGTLRPWRVLYASHGAPSIAARIDTRILARLPARVQAEPPKGLHGAPESPGSLLGVLGISCESL